VTHLVWRVRIFAVGAGLGLGGIFLDQSLLIWAAVVVLGAGMLLRIRARPGAPAELAESGDDPEN